ncbi:LexA family protein [Vogesella indigofera]|uniref:LexA family protein n=1 Tax=Vogesella indigofera TaxID=45465 RepID=UPI00234DA386|nr:translesion error-prone DNA polymerase V autoproteolytic subunit [Vogesella indigofera]MDC7703905.1 translesion error-prone DNA polymerase V autoproteolytic subunit [Vogesella indigofera]
MQLYLPVAAPLPQSVPLFGASVPAGFPSPADDYRDSPLDLNRYLIRDAASSFMVRVSGDSMADAGIHHGDLLVVDRGLPPLHGHIVLAAIDGAFTVKRLHRRDGRVALLAENAAYAPLELGGEQELCIWGVVTACVKRFT